MDPHLACSINQSLFSITLARHLPEKMEEIDGKKSKKKYVALLRLDINPRHIQYLIGFSFTGMSAVV